MPEKAMKVLVCDDSLLIRRQLTDLLTARGCTVVEAADGAQAAARYEAERPDCVFMDIVMPGCDGLDGLAKIRALDGEARVIMLSSAGTRNNLRRALAAGAVDFMQKPVDAGQIERVLARVAP